MQRIGIVGVGLLGSAVASRLLHSGFEVIGYDVPLPLTSTAHELYVAAAKTGAGSQDLAVVIRHLQQLANLSHTPQRPSCVASCC
jgi:3-hydroxyisobutyrate dehydrogenase-like beta-hydroxyacid dehydrogenase